MHKTWIFDCDGVILDSNNLKTDSFYEVALAYGKANAEKFVQYHKENGGISRYEKFSFFFKTILRKTACSDELNAALTEYGRLVKEKLLVSKETPCVRKCLNNLPEDAIAIVVSGGNQEEIREIFQAKGIDRYFSGIYGSPLDKNTIIQNLIRSKEIIPPAIFIGDSLYDYEVAKNNHFTFFFMSQYSEFADWKQFFAHEDNVKIIKNLCDFL
jgi:phosphoglycolate phosphatase-like HAD superfamily hydrolase